jgi:hypothetical protein
MIVDLLAQEARQLAGFFGLIGLQPASGKIVIYL